MLRFKDFIQEDLPTNNAGGGHVASIGVGDQGEPPVKSQAQKKKKKSSVMKRCIPSVNT